MAIAALATLATVVNVRFLDQMLDSSTGVFSVLCALIAVNRLAHRPLDGLARALWLFVLAVAVVVAGAEFAEPFAELKGHDFGLENVDDVLLLVAGPIALWLTSRIETRPVPAQLLLVAGLATQLAGAALDVLDDHTVLNFGLAVERVENYADFAQFLSLLFYFMALWLLVGRTVVPVRDRGEAVPISPYRPGLRDTLYPPPFLIGLGLADPRSPAGRVHRLCNDALWPAANMVISARNLGAIALWPVIAVWRAGRVMRRYGAAVQRLTGKSRTRQFLEQVSMAVRYRIAPVYYYVYEFYQPGRRHLAPHYLMRYETKEIAYRLLYPQATAWHEPTPLKNKLEFARHCRANDIRHVEVYMLFEDGKRVSAPDLLGAPPESDLFVKPIFGKGGGGAELWRYAGEGTYRSSRGGECDAAALAAHVAGLSRVEPFIIQQAVRNHHDLLDLGAGALSTVRLLSCRNEGGDYEATSAAFRMSVDPASPVDNFHAGGVAAAVDIATGRLGPATGLGMAPDFKWHDRHPFSGGRITNRQLPMWRETIDLAVRAHRIFPDYALIGWDIAIVEDGPCLIEGNRGPDVDIHQRTSRGPIGDGRFGELLAFNLERRTRAP
ncbi:MAG TPA: sugar-transfer associated ATP-grasp domain-containing protein [Dongiaceae bacterium]|nr:sugar-transfer associated ATP-grasp domain-containing protein [Dongiaceae bacterium]